MNRMKFQPGTFLEVDDLHGNRKVVMVGRDGVTYWDSLDPDCVTPVVIHPVLNPVDLGTLATFVLQKGLTVAVQKVMSSLSVHIDARKNDSLFVMRVLWNLATKVSGDGWTPDGDTVQWACQEADGQMVGVTQVHDSAARYKQIAAAA